MTMEEEDERIEINNHHLETVMLNDSQEIDIGSFMEAGDEHTDFNGSDFGEEEEEEEELLVMEEEEDYQEYENDLIEDNENNPYQRKQDKPIITREYY